MKSMFSKTLNFRFSCGKLLLFILLMLTSLESYAGSGGGDTSWNGTVSVSVGFVTSSTGNGTVYVSTDAQAQTGEETASTGISNSASTATFYLYAQPADGFTFAGWFTDTEGNNPATLTGNITGVADAVSVTGTKDNSTISKNFYAKFEVPDYSVILKASPYGKYKFIETRDGVDASIPVEGEDVLIENLDNLNIKLEVTEVVAGYEFLRWVIKKEGEQPKYFYNPSGGVQTYKVMGNTEISADFIPKSSALFIVMGDASTTYAKLSEALQVAATESKTVVLHRSGALFKEIVSTAYYDADANKYTIPSNVTLLIPNSNNSADYVVHMEDLTEAQIGSGFSEKMKLTIGDGQDIDVYGDICIYAKVAANSGAVGPYGRVHLGENSDITLKSGARLNALGYITGHKQSSVIAENGAIVREVLQVGDWRGGSALTDIAKNAKSHKVFPISQYYVQNVETKLVLQYGAIEYLTAFMEISEFKIPASAILISPQEGKYTGMFRMGTGTAITKHYDEATDRLKIDVEVEVESNVILDQVSLDLAKDDWLLQTGLKLYLGTTTITSADYVLPINNNMDIHIMSGITVDIQHDVALLAGAMLEVDKGATIQTSNGASMYVYDAEQHHVKFTEDDKNYSNPLYKDYYYNYFGASHAAIMPISNRPDEILYNRRTKDLVTWTNPEKAGNTTSLQKNDATIILNGEFNGAIYTTEGKASIISTDKSANAKVTFTGLSAQTIKQCVQTSDNGASKVHYPNVPCLPSAALKNADGTYSAGGEANEENDKIYTYYPSWNNGEGKAKGRWANSLPEGGEIMATELNGNAIEIYIPEAKNSTITFTPRIAEGFGVESIKQVSFNGDRFTANGLAKYENGVATIPYTYTPTQTHEDNITIDNPEKVTVSFNCTDIIGNSIDKSVTIDLTATQNYLPAFKINNEEANLQFATTIGDPSAQQTIKINPADADVANVADEAYKAKNYVEWTYPTLPVGSPFQITGTDYYAGVQVVYNPTSTDGTVDGKHTQVLTIKAKYADGVETTKEITLIGTPTLATNPLAFIAEEKEMYPNQTINQLFTSTGNGQKITFTYNDATTSDIIEIIPEIEDGHLIPVDEKFILKVKDGVDITTQQEITIKATQSANNQFGQGSSQIKVIITPEAQWEWSKLYFGHEYTTPITMVTGNDWTLTQQTECSTITSFEPIEGGEKNYKIVVGGNGPEDECEVTFLFKRNQDDPGRTFTSAIYADPRILPICFSDDPEPLRTFNDITVATNNVEYSDGILFATTEESGAAWTIEIIGVPNEMQFVPSGEGKRWTISEYDGANWTTTYHDAEIVLAAGQTHFVHKLKASTQQIRIACSLGAEQGGITDLCIYALDASASADIAKLYIPIVCDENGNVISSQRNVVLSYVSPSSDLWLSVVDGAGNTISDIILAGDNLSNGKLPKTTATSLYREETIAVSSTYPTEGTMYLLVKDQSNSEMLKLPIRLYHYPQPLPMRSADWNEGNAEKYNFYTNIDRTRNVTYDNVTQRFTFSPSGDNQSYIAFVFRGGPSYISFETQSEITIQSWYESWVLQVTADGETYYSIASDAESEIQPEISEIIRNEVTYYQVRVALPYLAKSLTLQKRHTTTIVENIVIDGEPDLDVVLGNHTIEHEGEVNFTPDLLEQDVVVTAINLEQLKVACNNPHFVVTYNTSNITSTPTTLTATECPNALGNYMVGNITLHVTWDGENTVEEGLLSFTDKNNQEMATIRLLGAKDFILQGNSQTTGLFTGFAKNITTHPFASEEEKYQYARREVNLFNTFDEKGIALFDYLIVYGETTAEDQGATILSANTTRGSNAHTPMYVYRKVANADGVYDRYQFIFDQVNVNQGQKPLLHTVVDAEGQQLIPHAKETDGTQYIDLAEGEKLSVYMTGFCPYASTGFEKTQEGVWLFRAKKNAKLDVYLEDCHIYSRNKTEDGHSFTGKNDPDANIFQEDYARGSGGVLVFECNQEGEYLDTEAFQVTIHTRGKNLLKSNYGCFYEIFGMRAYQVSSPVQIRLTSNINYVPLSKTHLTFDDKWPTDLADATKFKRTNGFLSLQKQANNAPSIDMGNGNTVVNFRGGQVELQNAQNVSDKYKTTLAISYRSGIMSTGEVQIQMAYGIGTDAATEGTVNFYDGTISVIPMYVDPEDRKYYLMDPQLNADGDTLKDEQGNAILSDMTSCLRCPQNTFVYGGSICMLRACMSPTSQGGAPTDGVNPLGRFFYTEDHGYEYNTADKQKPANQDDASQWLVNPVKFPSDITLFEGLADYHANTGKYTYGIESVTPNEDGQLILWIPDGFGGVKAEQDRYLTHWKACMPEITAILAEVGITKIGGSVGGPTAVENLEDVDNLLYCQMDEHIYDVISETTGEGEDERYVYEAPLKVPDGFQMDGVDLGFGDYLRLAPSNIGRSDEYEMENQEDYNINSKVYYVSSATADLWQTFTAPFDVERIWIVETFDENALSQIMVDPEKDPQGTTKRSKILKTQAIHNADFASFFGVAMALGSEKDFEGIFAEYMDWAAFVEDQHQGNIKDYTKRGKVALIPYDGTNWRDAHFYLYHNKGNWTIKDAENSEFVTQWDYVQKEGNVLLEKGETYSMFFPYANDWGEYDQSTRPFWDYWSGKLLIFESTQASKENPHVMRGSNYVAATKPAKGDWIFPSADVTEDPTEAIVTGNSTFAHMQTDRSDLFIYAPMEGAEGFYPLESEQTILPTETFLLANPPKNGAGMPARGIKRTGEIIYDKHGTSDVGHIPTVGGGHDLFITSIEGGINVAVAAPQNVRVLSSTGSVIYSGMIQTALDIQLPSLGMYVVSGEKEVQKVMY